jgi:hypothetical protein
MLQMALVYRPRFGRWQALPRGHLVWSSRLADAAGHSD